MRWISDPTGRFLQRPYYEHAELDQECENLLRRFLVGRYKRSRYPVSTNDLTILLDDCTDDLDLYADLSAEGEDVEGMTEFFYNRKPKVSITAELSEQTWREHRLRTTLTHELGHVHLHRCLCVDPPTQKVLYGGVGGTFVQRCRRDSILGAGQYDWMEWQAGYASGALLMPATRVRRIVDELSKKENIRGPIPIDSEPALLLIEQMQNQFDVSAEAARVRLMQMGHVAD
jgi:Zn-dependent peptidase ImmA (M78 family)